MNKEQAINMARTWLIRQFEEMHGCPIRELPNDVKDKYLTQLGLLVDFVTDCLVEKP